MEISLRRKLLSFVLVLSLLLQMVAPVFLSFAETPEEPPASEVEVETQDDDGESVEPVEETASTDEASVDPAEEPAPLVEPEEEAEEEEEVQDVEETEPVEEPQKETQDEEEDSEDSAPGGEENTESEEKEEPSDNKDEGPTKKSTGITGGMGILSDDKDEAKDLGDGDSLSIIVNLYLNGDDKAISTEEEILISEIKNLAYEIKFEIKDGTKINDGDYLEFDLSSFMEQLPELTLGDFEDYNTIVFTIIDSKGNKRDIPVFKYSLNDGKLKFEAYEDGDNLEELNNSNNRYGWFIMDFTKDKSDDDLPLEVTVKTNEDVPKDYTFVRDNPYKNNFVEKSVDDPANDADQIVWYIDVNKSLENLSGVKLVDIMPEGVHLESIQIVPLTIKTKSISEDGDFKNFNDYTEKDRTITMDLADLPGIAKRIKIVTSINSDVFGNNVVFKNEAKLYSNDKFIDDSEASVTLDIFSGVEKTVSREEGNKVKWSITFQDVVDEGTINIVDKLDVPEGMQVDLIKSSVKLDDEEFSSDNIEYNSSEQTITFKDVPRSTDKQTITYVTESFFDVDSKPGNYVLENSVEFNGRKGSASLSIKKLAEMTKEKSKIYQEGNDTFVDWKIDINQNNECWRDIVLYDLLPKGFEFDSAYIGEKSESNKVEGAIDTSGDQQKVTIRLLSGGETLKTSLSIIIKTKLVIPDELDEEVKNKAWLEWYRCGEGEGKGFNPGGNDNPPFTKDFEGTFDKNELEHQIAKSGKGINYLEKEASWKVSYQTYYSSIKELVIKDTLTDGLTEDKGDHKYDKTSLVLTLNGTKYGPIALGVGTINDLKYNLSFGSDERSFTLEIIEGNINEYANNVVLEYKTTFNLKDTEDKYENSSEGYQIVLSNEVSAGIGENKVSGKADQKLNENVSVNGDKDGKIEKNENRLFSWTVNLNYKGKAVEEIQDELTGSHRYVEKSIKLYKASMDAEGKLIKESPESSIDLTDKLIIYGNELTIDFGENPIKHPVILEYQTEGYGISTPKYSNSVVVNNVEYSKTLSYEQNNFVDKELNNGEKNFVYKGSVIKWTLRVNEDKSEIKNFILTDTLSEGLLFIEDSLVVKDSNGKAVNGLFELNYPLEDDGTFTLKSDLVDDFYTIEYETLVIAESDSKIKNDAKVSSEDLVIEEKSSDEYDVIKRRVSAGGGGNRLDHEFLITVVKVDENNVDITSNTAQFKLITTTTIGGVDYHFSEIVKTDNTGKFQVVLEKNSYTSYSIEEIEAPAGFEPYLGSIDINLDNAKEDGTLELRVENKKIKTSISGEKIWKDGGTVYKRPTSIDVELKRRVDGVEDPDFSENRTVKAEASNGYKWLYEFSDLDEYDDYGKKYEYFVSERTVPYNYKSEVDGNDIINTLSGTTEVKVSKTWKDSGYTDRPGEIVVNLWDNTKKVDEVKLSLENNWTHTFSDLKKYDENGKVIKYTIDEDYLGDGYSTKYTGDYTHGFTIINTRSERGQIEVSKKWLDGDNEGNDRPNSVTIHLWRKSATEAFEKYNTVEIKAEAEWKYKFDDLPMFDSNGDPYEYSVTEDTPAGYESTINNFTITNLRVGTTEITAKKIWKDGPDIKPKVALQLQRNDKDYLYPITLDGSEDWEYHWKDLDKYDENGAEYEYKVMEITEVDGYETSYSDDWTTITNTFIIEKVDVKANKVWIDGENLRDSIWFKLYRNIDGEDPEEVPLEKAEIKELKPNETEVIWEDMPKTDKKGNLYSYSVKEVDENGEDYTPEFFDKYEDGLTVTNTFIISTIKIKAEKIWEGAPDEKPQAEFELMRRLKSPEGSEGSEEDFELVDGSKKAVPLTPDGGQYLVVWSDIEKTDRHGNEYEYKVIEHTLDQYNHVIEGNMDDGFVVTNTRKTYAIGDYTWIDKNKDGIQDEDEKPLVGVKVELYDEEDNLLEDTLTDSEGRYIFDNLYEGIYKVKFILTEEQAKIYRFTKLNAGKGDEVGDDSDADPNTGWTKLITLNDDNKHLTKAEDYDYNEVQASEGIDPTWDAGVIVKNYAIGDYTWIDKNKDGIQDKDEKPLVGVKVELYDEEGNLLKTTTTDDSGFYLFDELDAGNYRVRFVLTDEQAKKYEFTKLNAGKGDEVGDDSDADPKTGWTKFISLDDDNKNLTKAEDYKTNKVSATEGIDPTWDAGVVVRDYAIGDYTWIDKNKDGIQDEDEEPLVGVKVELYDEEGKHLKTTTTDERGFYLFDELDAGNYRVRFVLTDEQAKKYKFTKLNAGKGDEVGDDSDADPKTGWTKLISLDDDNKNLTKAEDYKTNKVLATQGIDPTWDAGVIVKDYAVGDYTWIDKNKDGIQDKDEEPLAGVKVELYDEDGKLLATTTTDKDGFYLFDKLEAGKYKIRFVLTEEQAKKYRFTKQGAGADKALDSDADEQTGWTREIVLDDTNKYLTKDYRVEVEASEGIDPTWDAGVIVKSYAIGDYTWIDKNKDGIQDKDEESLAGVKVELYDEDGKLLATTTTDKDGYYLFDELAAGRYRVKFTLTKEQAKRYKFTKLNSGDDTSLDSDAIEATGWTRIIVLNDDNKYLTKTYRTDVKASEGIDPTWDAGVVEIEKTLPSTGAAPMGGLLMGGLGLLGAALVLLRKKED